jgi:hypothetical protein
VVRTQPQSATHNYAVICAPISKAVAKISRVEYQNAFPGLDEVGRDLSSKISMSEGDPGDMWTHLVPPERPGPGNEERLSGCRPHNVPDQQYNTAKTFSVK